MKKTLLAVPLLAIALSGCGQNVDAIKAYHAENNGGNIEQKFTGYTVTLTDEDLEDHAEYIEKNKMPTSVQFDDNSQMKPLPKSSLKGEHYKSMEAAQKQLAAIYKDIVVQVKAERDLEVKELESKIKANEALIAQYKEGLKGYYAATADTKAELDKAKAEVKALESKRAVLLDQFYAEFSEAVVANSLPIDKNQKINPSRFYRVGQESWCKKADQSLITYLSNGKSCVYTTISEEQISLAPALVKYGVAEENRSSELSAARNKEKAANVAYRNAATIANNQLNVSAKQSEAEIDKLERMIARHKMDIANDSNVTTKINRTVSSGDEAINARQAFREASRKHYAQLKIKSLSELDYDFSKFDDENDTPKMGEDEGGIAFFVFTDGKDNQQVHAARIPPNNKSTYLDIFKGDSRRLRTDTLIKGEDEIMELVIDLMY